jgi:hypothetical protein
MYILHQLDFPGIYLIIAFSNDNGDAIHPYDLAGTVAATPSEEGHIGVDGEGLNESLLLDTGS